MYWYYKLIFYNISRQLVNKNNKMKKISEIIIFIFSLIFFFSIIFFSIIFKQIPYGIKGLKMLKQKDECITSNNLEIFKTLTNGVALASYSINSKYTINYVLLIDESERLFYDGEKKNPKNYWAKQIGTYTYKTINKTQKTIPAVIIEKK